MRHLVIPLLIMTAIYSMSCLAPKIASTALQRESSRDARKFFDLDENGRLNRHEIALLQTHLLYKWELADSKKKKLYDTNGDHMLSPPEWQRYKDNELKDAPSYLPKWKNHQIKFLKKRQKQMRK